MFPFPSPSGIAQHYPRPAVTSPSSTVLAASPIVAAGGNADPSLLSRIAGSALSSIKLSACCAIAASLAGLGTGAAALVAVGALTVGTTVCLVEAASARQDDQLPSAIVQHGVCNDWHTLIGGLAGGTPTTVALTALASALAVTAADGPPRLGTNGLACLAVLKELVPSLNPVAAAGLSLGEFTAHAAAGTYSFEEGLKEYLALKE